MVRIFKPGGFLIEGFQSTLGNVTGWKSGSFDILGESQENVSQLLTVGNASKCSRGYKPLISDSIEKCFGWLHICLGQLMKNMFRIYVP